MKIVNNVMYMSIFNVCIRLEAETDRFYYIINRSKNEWLDRYKVDKFPEPIVIGKTDYYSRADLEVFKEFFRLAEEDGKVRGRFERAYEQLSIRLKENAEIINKKAQKSRDFEEGVY